MKSLVFIVLVIVAAIAGYSFINKSEEAVVVQEVMTEKVEQVENENEVTPILEEASSDTEATEEISMITPADMSDSAQTEMYDHIMQYNKCMMQNRLEYHQSGVRAESVADKTLTACEPHLDDLKLTLENNNVNKDLREGMVKTMRQRAARKLMSNVMQSLAGQAAAAANSTPIAPAPAVTP